MMLPIDASELIPMSRLDTLALRRRLFDPDITPAKLRARAEVEAIARACEEVARQAAATKAEREAEKARIAELVAKFQEVPVGQAPPPPPRKFTDREILRQVSAKHAIDVADIVGPRQWHALCRVRDEALWRIRHETTLSYPNIGRRFGGRDHTSVITAVRRHQARLDAEGAR